MAIGAAGKKKRCKDCPEDSKRDAPFPGPRCATHNRKEKQRAKNAAHDKMVQRVYHLQPGEYAELYEIQDGQCALCGPRAKGLSRKLPVDHDHACCNDRGSCGKCVRGLLCGRCNDMLGHGRDSIEFFERVIEYLKNPPASKLSSRRGNNNGEEKDG